MTNRALVAVVATTVALVAGGGVVAASITMSEEDAQGADTTAAPSETVSPGSLAIGAQAVGGFTTDGSLAPLTTASVSIAVASATAGSSSAPATAPQSVPETVPPSPGTVPAPETTVASPPASPAPAPARFRLSTTTLDLGATETVASFIIVNIGGRSVDWRVEGGSTPFVVAGGIGTLASGQAAQVAVVLDRTNLSEGDYATTLVLVGTTPTPIVVTARVERAPVVALLRHPDPPSQQACRPREVSLAVEAGDESGITSVVAELHGPTGSGSVGLEQEGPWTLTVVPPPVAGDWTLDIVATDGRGNQATVTTGFVLTDCPDDDGQSLLA